MVARMKQSYHRDLDPAMIQHNQPSSRYRAFASGTYRSIFRPGEMRDASPQYALAGSTKIDRSDVRSSVRTPLGRLLASWLAASPEADGNRRVRGQHHFLASHDEGRIDAEPCASEGDSGRQGA